MNMLDLFSGIGGFSLAAQRAGFKIDNHYYSEIDKYAQQIYRRQFPESIRLGDITKIGNEHGGIDIITGGFPCQSFSIAGKRGGFSDTRGTLFFEIERLAGIYRPKYMVLENVKGLLNHDRGNTIRVILDKLKGLDYTVQMLLLNTVDFSIPQNRERVFFICTAPGQRRPEISHIREAKKKNTFSANCIDANYGKGIDNHGQRTCIAINNDLSRNFKTNITGIIPTLRAQAHGNLPVVQVGTLRDFKGEEGFREMKSGNGTIIRRLTPVECERLQDYPDDWTKTGIADNNDEGVISDSQRYKTLGNSITVKVAEEIFKTIKTVFDETKQEGS